MSLWVYETEKYAIVHVRRLCSCMILSLWVYETDKHAIVHMIRQWLNAVSATIQEATPASL